MRVRIKSTVVISIVLLSLLLLWGCNSAIDYLSKGYKDLKNGNLNSAANYFLMVLENSSNSEKLSEASEGLGWVNLLEGAYSTALDYFNRSVSYNCQNADAYLGLAITAWETADWDNLVFAAQDFDKLTTTSYKFQLLPQKEISWLDCMKLLATGYFMKNRLGDLRELIDQLPSDDFVEKLREVIE